MQYTNSFARLRPARLEAGRLCYLPKTWIFHYPESSSACNPGTTAMIKSIIQFFDRGDQDPDRGSEDQQNQIQNQNELDRMVKMRNRITHNKLKAMQAADNDGVGANDDNSEQNLISRAKNSELESGRGSKRLIQNENKSKNPSISLLSGLADRVSHLDGAY